MRRPRPASARARARPRARASRATTSTSARARLLRPAVTPPLRRRRRGSPEATPFQAMGVEIAVCGASDDELDAIRRLFEEWDGVLSRPPGTELDLNGVVKSLAVDSALELISGDGFVAAGGDVAVRGGALIALPAGGEVQLLAGGMATSGSTKRRWLRGGSVQHHLIDPRTGRPAESRWDEVTVAAGSCVAADVAAKAAFLLSDHGPGWLDDRGLAGRFRDGEVFAETRAWNELLLQKAA